MSDMDFDDLLDTADSDQQDEQPRGYGFLVVPKRAADSAEQDEMEKYILSTPQLPAAFYDESGNLSLPLGADEIAAINEHGMMTVEEYIQLFRKDTRHD